MPNLHRTLYLQTEKHLSPLPDGSGERFLNMAAGKAGMDALTDGWSGQGPVIALHVSVRKSHRFPAETMKEA